VLPTISVSEFLSNPLARTIIDVRSESEFSEAHIPGARNVPLLNDAERAEVGTLYKQNGPEPARLCGLELVGPKLASMMSAIDGIARRSGLGSGSAAHVRSSLLIHCWRGGARSQSVAAILKIMKYDVAVLEGGHKAFRNFVQEFLNQPRYPFKLCTVYGLTGAGKTEMLRQWKAEGKPIIDLEGLAHHRGSAFGQVGIDQYGQQKEFENNLFWEMWRLRHEPVVVIEGESRRIGRCQLPESFMEQMASGFHVLVDKSVDERAEHIMKIYVEGMERDRLLREARSSLDAIRKRLGGEKHNELGGLLERGEFREFIRILLRDYYDRMYANSRASDDFYHVCVSNAADWGMVRGLWG